MFGAASPCHHDVFIKLDTTDLFVDGNFESFVNDFISVFSVVISAPLRGKIRILHCLFNVLAVKDDVLMSARWVDTCPDKLKAVFDKMHIILNFLKLCVTKLWLSTSQYREHRRLNWWLENSWKHVRSDILSKSETHSMIYVWISPVCNWKYV